MSFLAPLTRQAAAEFPAALDALRDQLAVDDGPISVLGASLGAAVALQVLTTTEIPIRSVALVNPAVRLRSVVGLTDDLAGHPYRWTPQARRVADDMDFVARTGDLTTRPPLLLVSGEQDHPDLRMDATDLVEALRRRYTDPSTVELVTVRGLAHPLADEPGLEPAPQRPTARAVDEILTRWFTRHLTG
ncbi:hypothetical protein GCM10017691_38450 [Pseudonocardia petroleophila]|uniref:alpha/beta hydrolase family protein n=1 Tax=Pseudonocardia petroleophila TaxID=37331 RepID=UPI0031D6DCFB